MSSIIDNKNENSKVKQGIYEKIVKIKIISKKQNQLPEVFYKKSVLNPFLANVPILYPLKTPENLWFSEVFRGYKMGTLARNGLRSASGLQLY